MKQRSELQFKKKSKNRFFNTMLFLATGVTVYTLLFTTDTTYNLLWLLPFGYFVSTLIYYGIFTRIEYNYGVVFIAANIIIFIRYVVTPFSIVFSSAYSGLGFGPNPTQTSMNLAIILMIFELVSVYFITVFAILHYKKKQQRHPEMVIKVLSNKSIIILFMLLTLPIILAVSPDSLVPNSLSSIGDNSESLSSLPLSGFFLLIIPVLRLGFLLVSLSFIKKLYDKSNNGFLIVLAWLVVFLYLGMLISTSRWIIVFSSIVCMLIMARLFPKTPRIFYGILIFTTVLIFASISIYKFTWALDSSQNPYRDIFNVLFGQFQEYFSGPRVVAQSLDMISFFGNQIGISTLVNDFLGSIPLLSNFIDQNDRINVYFNLYLNVGNVSHIIPMIGNSYAYFPFFPVLFMLLAQWLMIRFDFKSQNEENIEFKYIYAYIGLFFAMSMGFNVQIIFGNFIMYFLLPWCIFSINRRVALKTSRYKMSNKGGY
jgi:hypothetical protein